MAGTAIGRDLRSGIPGCRPGQFTVEKIRFTYRNDPLENQVISEFRWVKIKRKSGSILLDNQQERQRLTMVFKRRTGNRNAVMRKREVIELR